MPGTRRAAAAGKMQKRVLCDGDRTMSGPAAILEMPALGRPFQLGMLYDCFRDILLSEYSLLDPVTCQKNTEKTTQNSHTLQEVSSDSLGEKAAALDIKPSLMTSILCDLFEMNGAAEYLFSTKKSRYQERVTYKNLTTERVEQLTLDGLTTEDLRFSTIPHSCKPSHVVTAVWYGEQSFQDYDKEVSTLENVEEKIGSSEVMLLPQGKTGLTMDEVGKIHQGVSSTFCDDASLGDNAVTFQDGRKILSSSPKLLGWSRETAVPVKVRLYPLMRLQGSWMQFLGPFHEISELLNSNIKDIMEGLIEAKTHSEDLLRDPTVKTFPEISKKIQQFKDLCGQYKEAFQKQLAEIVPLVREGVREEKDLKEVLEGHQKSPFDTKGLREFLSTKEREIAFLNSLLSVLKDIEIVCPKEKLEGKVSDPTTDFVVAFLFTSLGIEEPFLSRLEAHLSSSGPLDDSSWETLSCPPWHEDKGLLTKARSFSAFAHANPSSQKTQFVVASLPGDGNPGASIYLYESGDLRGTEFEPPSKPLPMQIDGLSAESVHLRLTPGASGADSICCFQVEHRVVGQDTWSVEVTKGRGEAATIQGLRPDTEYEFRYAAVSKPGRSERSDISGIAKTPPRSPPSRPQEANGGSPVPAKGDTNIRTDERNTCCAQEATIVKEEEGIKWNQRSTGQETENKGGFQTFTSNPLADYVAPRGPSAKREPSNLANSLLRASHQVRSGHPAVYDLPLRRTTVCNAALTCLKYSLGKESSRLHHKVVLLLGETGAGKSTLIGRMVNYVLGVQWEDDFRFRIVPDVPKRSQALSQTDTLTAYEINLSQGLQVPYSLTLIDTPGFGDTRGIEHDRMLLEQIREFFLIQEGVDHVDAVCVVVQASQPRLTQTQKYIFNSILSIFGKDIQESIQVLITFADGRGPPVLEAINAADVPCARDAKGIPAHFAFNNSALFSTNVQDEGDSYHFNQMFWQMGVRSLQAFFQSLGSLEPRSLTLTTDVLNERKALEAVIQGMKPQIQMALVKVEELRKTQKALRRHQRDMEANRNFEYELERTVPCKTDISGTGYYINNCQRCHTTCHYPCHIRDLSDKRRCSVINKTSGRCRVCPGKCRWEAHISQSYKWDYYVIQEKWTYTDLKQKYEQAHGKLMTQASAWEWLSQECRKAEEGLEDLVRQLSHHLQRLQEIALKSTLMTTSEYLDLLIGSEEEELQAGYGERINLLRSLKTRSL